VTDYQVDDLLDLRGVLCPINFVKTKLKLDEMESGRSLEVWLDQGDPIANVPRSVKDEGHQILKVDKQQDGYYRMVIRKG
jgi:tRNA 2-thiouridine synthesizing protein A